MNEKELVKTVNDFFETVRFREGYRTWLEDLGDGVQVDVRFYRRKYKDQAPKSYIEVSLELGPNAGDHRRLLEVKGVPSRDHLNLFCRFADRKVNHRFGGFEPWEPPNVGLVLSTMYDLARG